ncbi:MAG: signal peptidase I [Halococcoides sp.]
MIDRTRIVWAVVLALLAGVAVMGVVAVPGLIGADHSYVVLSSSMEPAISPGSVVIVTASPTDQIDAGDVITYRHPEGSSTRVTHRVVEVIEDGNDRQFRTRGDALEQADVWTISGSDVIGRVTLTIPFVGYLVQFANSTVGIIALVIVPAVALGISELLAVRTKLGEES